MAITLTSQNITNMYTPVELITTGVWGGASGGITDHGDLHGLADNDHPQYLLTSVSSGFLQASHDHGGAPSITGQIGGTIASNAWSLSIPSFLLTAAESDHTHSDLYIALSESTAYQTSVLSTKFLTTAANSTHTHGAFVGTNITAVSSGSAGLALSVGNYLTTAANSTHAHGNASAYFTNLAGGFVSASSGLTLSVSAAEPLKAGISTMGNTAGTTGTIKNGQFYLVGSDNVTLSQSLNGSDITLSIIAGGGGANDITLGGNTDGTLTEISTGTVTIAGGDNITLSQDGNAFTIVGAASGTDAGIAFSMSASNTSGTASLVSTGTLYMEAGANLTLSQNSNTIKFVGNTPVTTYMGSDQASNFAGIGSTTESTAGTDLVMTVNTDGVHLGVPAWITVASVTASNSVYAGDYVSVSTDGVATTVSVAGVMDASLSDAYIGTIYTSYYQATSNNSLSAGVSHTHGSLATGTRTGTVVSYSSASSGLSMSFPNWLTTAAQISHSHGAVTTVTQNSTITDVKYTSASSGLTLGMPKYAVTSHTHSNLYIPLSASTAYQTSVLSNTFAKTDHTHSQYLNSSETGSVYFVDSLGNNITWGSSTTNGSTSIYASVGAGTAGGDGSITVSMNDNIVGSTTFTQAQSAFRVWVNGIIQGGGSDGMLQISALEQHHIYLYGNTSNSSSASSDYLYLSAGNNITLAGSNGSIKIEGAAGGGGGNWELEGANTAGTTSASFDTLYLSGGNNVTLSGNSNTIVFSVNATGANDGVNIIAAGASTANTTGTIIFSNSNGVSFGLNGATVTASHNAYSATSQLSSKFLTTAANSTHSHGAVNITTKTGTNISISSASNGWSLSHPVFVTNALTTAAASNHSHGNPTLALTNITGTTASASNGLTLSLSGPSHGNLYFSDIAGYSWGSSVDGVSTSIYLVTA